MPSSQIAAVHSDMNSKLLALGRDAHRFIAEYIKSVAIETKQIQSKAIP